MSFTRLALQAAVRRACELDVNALKPGNVGIDSPGYGMTAADFFASAAAITEPITLPRLSVGERIYLAIEATQKVVSCNTNLGIVLLLAPLIQAAELSSDFSSLRQQLDKLLRGLSIDDAKWAYRAIRLAKPGGMGATAQHDIADTPSVTLFQAMQEAANHDQIAQLYTTGYRALFERGLPAWRNAIARGNSPEWAATALFLNLLAAEPDSLIARKFGRAKSEDVTVAAKSLCAALEASRDPSALRSELLAWDAELKANGLNPGTCADMTVATIFLADLQDMR
jgi:triphosphoribosyl-dephospho-CoA synthase